MKKFLHFPLYILIFIFILFEDLIWKTLAKPIADYIQSLKIFTILEWIISKLNIYLVLVLFLALLVASEALGAIAVAFIGKGMVFAGLGLYIAKIPIVSFTFWLFKISKEDLLKINWFNKAYAFLMKVINWIKNTDPYTNTMDIVHNFKEKIKLMFSSKKRGFIDRMKRLYVFFKNRIDSVDIVLIISSLLLAFTYFYVAFLKIDISVTSLFYYLIYGQIFFIVFILCIMLILHKEDPEPDEKQ
jgi:hypothetical protein